LIIDGILQAMQHKNCRLVIFSRTLRPGKTKTRLSPVFSGKEACEIHAALLEDVVSRAWKAVGEVAEVRLAWGGSPDPAIEGALQLPAGLIQETQPEGDLGMRMAMTIQSGLREGYRTVVLGSDSPTLPPHHIESAFAALGDSEVVLGPAGDGGYYLVGMSRLRLEIFRNIKWGTADVMKVTRKRLKASGTRFAEIGTWHDVDTPEDVMNLWEELLRLQERHPQEVPEKTFAALSRLVPGRTGFHQDGR
jgi:rSAM/selenodomain-associated transferase 1